MKKLHGDQTTVGYIRVFVVDALYKSTFTYLLTYRWGKFLHGRP